MKRKKVTIKNLNLLKCYKLSQLSVLRNFLLKNLLSLQSLRAYFLQTRSIAFSSGKERQIKENQTVIERTIIARLIDPCLSSFPLAEREALSGKLTGIRSPR